MITGRFYIERAVTAGLMVLWFFSWFFSGRGEKVLFWEFCDIAKAEYFGYASQMQYMQKLVKAARILRDYSDDYLKSIYNGNKPFSPSFKKQFPKPVDLGRLTAFYQEHLKDEYVTPLADAFGVPVINVLVLAFKLVAVPLVVFVEQVPLVFDAVAVILALFGLPGNDMEGGGERHPGEPPRTLGQLDPKLGKQKTLAQQNTTQAHKVRRLSKLQQISHCITEYTCLGLGLFLAS